MVTWKGWISLSLLTWDSNIWIFRDNGKTSAGSWFHNLQTLGINERQNWDYLGFCSWKVKVYIREKLFVVCQVLLGVELKTKLPGNKVQRNIDWKHIRRWARGRNFDWKAGTPSFSFIAFFWTESSGLRFVVERLPNWENSTRDWASPKRQGECTDDGEKDIS